MKSRSGIQVMAGLIGMIRPLLSKMCLAVLMGCVGNLMATFITVLGAYGLTTLLGLTGGCAAWHRRCLQSSHRFCFYPASGVRFCAGIFALRGTVL
mgnify:CR=1 FL=1